MALDPRDFTRAIFGASATPPGSRSVADPFPGSPRLRPCRDCGAGRARATVLDPFRGRSRTAGNLCQLGCNVNYPWPGGGRAFLGGQARESASRQATCDFPYRPWRPAGRPGKRAIFRLRPPRTATDKSTRLPDGEPSPARCDDRKGPMSGAALHLIEQHYWAETAQQTTGETPVPRRPCHSCGFEPD